MTCPCYLHRCPPIQDCLCICECDVPHSPPLSSTSARPCSCGIAKEGETTTHPSVEVIVHVAYPSACYVAEASSSTPADQNGGDRG